MKTLSSNEKKEENIISSKEGCVFLVDDNPVFLGVMESEIKEIFPKAKVKSFITGEEAISRISKDHPFLVFLDYDLAGTSTKLMNGIAVLKKIKKEIPDTQVVMISGVDNLAIVTTSMKYGAFDYILKGEKALYDIRRDIEKILRRFRVSDENKEFSKTKVLVRWLFVLIVAAFLILLYRHYHP